MFIAFGAILLPPPLIGGGLDLKRDEKAPTRAQQSAAERAESPQSGLLGGRVPGVWLASFKQPSAVHGEVGKSATSVGLRAPAGRFDAAKDESIDTGDGRRAVSSSPGRGP